MTWVQLVEGEEETGGFERLDFLDMTTPPWRYFDVEMMAHQLSRDFGLW